MKRMIKTNRILKVGSILWIPGSPISAKAEPTPFNNNAINQNPKLSQELYKIFHPIPMSTISSTESDKINSLKIFKKQHQTNNLTLRSPHLNKISIPIIGNKRTTGKLHWYRCSKINSKSLMIVRARGAFVYMGIAPNLGLMKNLIYF